GSKALINGDPSQVDLPKAQASGLINAVEVLESVQGLATTRFASRDVVRHPLVARIVDAYDKAATMSPEPATRVSLAVQYCTAAPELPRWRLRRWVQGAVAGAASALREAADDGQSPFSAVLLTLRLVGAEEGQDLNREFRARDYATNVLTFEYGV